MSRSAYTFANNANPKICFFLFVKSLSGRFVNSFILLITKLDLYNRWLAFLNMCD